MRVLWLDKYQEDQHDVVGGKCAGLGAMIAADFPVPPAFAVTVDAYKESITRTAAGAELEKLLRAVDVDDLEALRRAAAAARSIVKEAGAASAVRDAVTEAYESLCSRLGSALPVAVRSSATAEDLPNASFAGEHDTFLWVRGADEVVARMVDCWASLYTDRAIAYRDEIDIAHDSVHMAVGVQQMVEPRASGVAMTLDPSNGDRSKVAIDAAWGLGEAVVAGEVTPDHFLVDKVVFEIVASRLSKKEIEAVVVDNRVHRKPLDDDRALHPSLTDAEVKAVARLARRAEKHFGRPQDVEWAIDGHSEQPVVHMLQSRPETVWSNKPRPSVSDGVTKGIEGVVSTLLSPFKFQKPVGLDEGEG